MRNYKLVVMLPSSTTKEKKEKLIDEIGGWMGKVTVKTSDLGEKKLAYPIGKNKSADYVLFEISGDTIAADAQKKLTISDDVVRHLMVRTN